MATNLLDVIPQPVRIPVGEVSIEVFGFDMMGLASLLARFPAIKAIFNEREKLDVVALAEQAPDLVAALVAAATGNADNPAQEEAAGKMPIGLQVDILLAALGQTFPQGLNSFLERLEKALPGKGGGGIAALSSALATKSPKQ